MLILFQLKLTIKELVFAPRLKSQTSHQFKARPILKRKIPSTKKFLPKESAPENKNMTTKV